MRAVFASTGQLTSAQRSLVVPTLADVIRVSPCHARVFFFDDTSLHWCPDIGRIYQLPRGQVKINSPGTDKVRYLLGSVEYPSGEGLYEVDDHKRHQEVRQHLPHLMAMYPTDYCFVVWDSASSHTTPMLWPFLWEHQHRLTTVPLPTYSPHLNLIERLWRFMRGQMTRNHFYESLQELCEALTCWLECLPPERFQSLMGIQAQTQAECSAA